MNVKKLSVAVVVAVVCGAVAFAGIALASAVRTKVTIQAQQGGFFGYVHSKKQSCEAGRKVALYKQKGNSPDRSVDDKIGTDVAQPNGPDSQWSVNTNKHGMFYAFAHRTSGCKKGLSETVPSQ